LSVSDCKQLLKIEEGGTPATMGGKGDSRINRNMSGGIERNWQGIEKEPLRPLGKRGEEATGGKRLKKAISGNMTRGLLIKKSGDAKNRNAPVESGHT